MVEDRISNPESKTMRLSVVSLTTIGREVCSFAYSMNKQSFIEDLGCARCCAAQKREIPDGGRWSEASAHRKDF